MNECQCNQPNNVKPASPIQNTCEKCQVKLDTTKNDLKFRLENIKYLIDCDKWKAAKCDIEYIKKLIL